MIDLLQDLVVGTVISNQPNPKPVPKPTKKQSKQQQSANEGTSTIPDGTTADLPNNADAQQISYLLSILNLCI